MKRIWLLLIILGFTFLITISVILLLPKTKYTSLVISNEEWNNIINTRNNSSDIKIAIYHPPVFIYHIRNLLKFNMKFSVL